MTKQTHRLRFTRFLLRSTALLMVFCLLPLWAAPAEASEAQATNLFGSTLADSGETIKSAALANSTLYIETSKSLYTFSLGDQAPVKRVNLPEVVRVYASQADAEGAEPTLTGLFSDGMVLYTVDTFKQTLYTISIENEGLAFNAPVKLDLSDFIEGEAPYEMMRDPEWAAIMDGRLYMKAVNFEGKPIDLYSFNLTSGEKRSHQAPHLFNMVSYKDGKALAVYHDQMNMNDPLTGEMIKPELVLFNPQDDSVEHLGIFPPAPENASSKSPMYYDAAEDSLYLFTDTDLYRLDASFSILRLIGYLPMLGSYLNVANGGLLPLPDGRLAVTFGMNTFLRERTEKGLEGMTVLSFGGSLDEPVMIQRVLMEMDGVVMRRVEGVDYGYVDADTLASMFLTNSVTVDLMPLNVYGFDLDKLMQKGYLADLSGSEVIRNYVGKMPSNFSRAVQLDGQVFAVPLSLMTFPLFAYVKPFGELNLKIPGTVKELLALAGDWANGLGEANPDYQFLANETNLKQALSRIVLESYVNQAFGAGEELVFDTPLFRELMQNVETIPYGDMNMEIDWSTPEGAALGEEMANRSALFEASMGYEPRYSAGMNNSGDRQHTPLILPPDTGMAGYWDVNLPMLGVLSTSKNKDTAIRFIEHYIDKMDALDKAAFDSSQSEPIPNPGYDAELKRQDENLRLLNERYATAESALKGTLEQDMAYFNEYIERYREQGKYLATAEDVRHLHEVVGKLYVLVGLDNAQRQAIYGDSRLLQQYLDGAITLDQFIRQADDKLRLVRMEYQ